MLGWPDLFLRLTVAVLAGGALGLNRDLHHKPIGVRTLALVSLAGALIITLGFDENGRIGDSGSRMVQGLLTGIGFLGAGVIVHAGNESKTHGLTSAACVWFTACVGILCGAGEWRILLIGGVLCLVVLTLGGPFERAFHRAHNHDTSTLDDESP